MDSLREEPWDGLYLSEAYAMLAEPSCLSLQALNARENGDTKELFDASLTLASVVGSHLRPDADTTPPPRTDDPVKDVLEGVMGPHEEARRRVTDILVAFSRRETDALPLAERLAMDDYGEWLDYLELPDELIERVLPMIEEAHRQFAISYARLARYMSQ
jgi:hypothetical protein